MRTITVGDTSIQLYSSIKELPIELSKKFHNYLLQDIGIGSTMQDVDEHLAKCIDFLNADKKEYAIEEAYNLRFNLFSMLSKWHYGALSFLCLVKSINDKELTDYTTEGLDDITKTLSEAGLTTGMVEDYVDEVKKKWIPKGSFTSPDYSETT